MIIKLSQLINQLLYKPLKTLGADTSVPKKYIWPLAKSIKKVKSEIALWNKTKRRAV